MRTRLLAIVALLIGSAACGDKGPPPVASAEAAPPPATPPPVVASAKPERHPVFDAPTWKEAFAAAKPGDAREHRDRGATVLAIWASKRMRWDDVVVAQDETSFARVLKDPDAERGRRMCVGTTIVSIEVDRSTGEPINDSLLMTGARNYINVAGVGSSGDLLARSHARFCGFVTGLFSYSNTGGGTTHGIQMVGMFDLPENRKRESPVAAKSASPKPAGTGTIIDINSL